MRIKHLIGRAADIIVKGVDLYTIIAVAESVFYNCGLGQYEHFIHVDTRGKAARW